MPLEHFISQVRRWAFTDVILAILYLVYALTQTGILSDVCWVLCVFYLMDGGSLAYITDLTRVYTLPALVFQSNTALNIITLGINLAYNALEIKYQGFKNPLLIIVAVFVTIYKATKCLVIHKLGVRVITEGGAGDKFREPLTLPAGNVLF